MCFFCPYHLGMFFLFIVLALFIHKFVTKARLLRLNAQLMEFLGEDLRQEHISAISRKR